MNKSVTQPESNLTLTPVDFDPFAEGELLITAPSTEAQKEIWASAQMSRAANCAFNLAFAIWLRGPLNVDALRRAIQQLAQRHQALRATFTPDGETLCIADSLAVEIPLVDLSNLSQPEQQARWQKILADEASKPFNLEHAPLFRVQLVKMNDAEHIAAFTIHHIIGDGWSQGVLQKELGVLYSAICQGVPADLPPAPQFSDYAIAQMQQNNQTRAAEAFWLKQFAGNIPVLDLPLDHPRPPVRTYNGGCAQGLLDAGLVSQLKQIGAKTGSTLFTTVLAGYKVFLHRLSGQNDLVVGLSVAGQSVTGQTGLVGHCVNLLPLRSHISAGQNFSDYLDVLSGQVLDAFDHQNYTFGSLLKKLPIARDASRVPLVQVTFSLDRSSPGFEFDGLEADLLDTPRNFETFEIFLETAETGRGLEMNFKYNADLFDELTMRRRVEEFKTLLQGIANNPDQPVGRLPLLPPKEWQQVVVGWNDTRRDYPRHLCIHHLFEAQATQTPDAVAVIFKGEQLTYGQLNRQANRLARHLRSIGAGPDRPVGIFMERSPEMVVGVLGILKAGSGYLPLDPDFPKERIAFMLEDAQVPVLLTQASLLEQLPPQTARVVCIDSDGPVIAACSSDNPGVDVKPEHLAYIIYTSGSTGNPKGVQVTHQTVVNFLTSMRHEPGLTAEDVLLSVTTLSFDIAGLELFLPLAVGAKIVLAGRETISNGEQLLGLLASSRATVLQATPATWRLLIAAGWQGSGQLKVLCGGEAMPPDLARELVNRSPEVWNMYGPTETTIWSTCYRLTNPDGPVLIGRPIANTQIYILDDNLQPVPIGVPGELYIGGEGVARGYLRRPELTESRFVPNPFSSRPNAKMYKTGDVARYRADGNLEFLGRRDNQVKLRGVRIELGEIESLLAQHPAVQQAVVDLKEDPVGDKSLVGYIVLNDRQIRSDISAAYSANWQKKWEILYQAGLDGLTDEDGSTGQVLKDRDILKAWTNRDDEDEALQEWIDQTVNRIMALKPNRVLEIGCGTGQFVREIAPHCSYYFATDYTEMAIQEVKKLLRSPQYRFPPVDVAVRPADNFEGLEPASFDTVILSSVIQYFPDIDYLRRVIEGAVALLKPGGCIYIGDAQSYALLQTFHVSDQIERSPALMTKTTLKQIVANRLMNEDELMVDPDFFYALRQQNPAIGRVEMQLRRGRIWNETTRFHYDVFIYVEPKTAPLTPQWHHWQQKNLSLANVRQFLANSQPDLYCVTGIPNARIQKEVAIANQLEAPDGPQTVAEILEKVQNFSAGVDPEELWALENELPYRVEIRWAGAGKDGYIEAVFKRIRPGGAVATVEIAPSATEANLNLPWTHYANSPMLTNTANELIPQLRAFLKEKLPDYMLPTNFMALDHLPLTPNGKIDRRALPTPDQARPEQAQSYVSPRTPIEEQVAQIWAQVLGLERVGVNDNFFELGGHSLRAIQVIARLRESFRLEIPLDSIFDVPTVAALTQRIEALLYVQKGLAAQAETEGKEYEEFEI